MVDAARKYKRIVQSGICYRSRKAFTGTIFSGLPGSGDVFLYSDLGWMTFSPDGYKTCFGNKNEPGPAKSDKDFPAEELHD